MLADLADFPDFAENVLVISEAFRYAPRMGTVTEDLRNALEQSGESRYAVSKATGIPQSGLSRFANGYSLRGENIDKLAEHLGLELRPVRRQRKAK